MDRVGEILTFLREAQEYVSGDLISTKLGISRTAIWKHMHHLDRLGYDVVKLKGKGYKLVKIPDRLYAWEIDRHLGTAFMGREIVYRENVDSTNSLAFKLALDGASEGTSIVAEAQKMGRGRLNRPWFSPPGKNLYLSVILRPGVHPSRVYPITFISSLAVADTIAAAAGLQPTLKWPNDVLVNGKKICGTLLELSIETDVVKFVVVGTGLNINMKEIDQEIKEKATSLYLETKMVYERPLVCAILLSKLEKYYLLFKDKGETEICRIWEERAQVKGKHLEITQMGQVYRGISEGLDSSGAMLLNIDGQTRRIIAGDVNF